MNIKTRPFLIGSGISIVLLILINLVSMGLTRMSLDTSLNDPTNVDASLLMLTSAASLISCLCGIASVAVGATVYARLHNQEEPIDSQDGIVGGAAVGAVAYTIAGILGLILNVLFVLPNSLDSAGIPADIGGDLAPVMLASGIAGGLIGLCFSIGIGAAIGAATGALASSFLNRN